VSPKTTKTAKRGTWGGVLATVGREILRGGRGGVESKEPREPELGKSGQLGNWKSRQGADLDSSRGGDTK